MASVRIFICYSHRDSEYLSPDSLLGFLRGLEGEEDVELWCDQRIENGALWDDQIRRRLVESDIALVLVSQSFLDSAYCSNIEMQTFLNRRREDGMILFPILLSPCEWERREWLAATQCLPGGDETIEEHYAEPAKRKRLFLRIRKELREAVARVRSKAAPAAAPAPEANQAGAISEWRPLTAIRCDIVPLERDGRQTAGDELSEILHDLMPEFVQVCTEVFDSFKGRVGDTAGNGVLGLFGYPTAHEDDNRCAVRAGLAVVERGAKLSARVENELGIRVAVRVGIHAGRVIADTSGQTPLAQLANRETAQVAARLQEIAPLNAVVVSDVLFPLIEGFFETGPGERCGSGVGTGDPRPPHHPRHRLPHPDADLAGQMTRFVGREKELDLLVRRWNDARAGQGQMVVIRADAGIGKSRLLAETRKRVADESSYWFSCRSSSRYQNSAFFPLVGWLESWMGIEPSDSDAVKLQKIEKMLAPFAAAIDDPIPPVAALLSITDRPAVTLLVAHHQRARKERDHAAGRGPAGGGGGGAKAGRLRHRVTCSGSTPRRWSSSTCS